MSSLRWNTMLAAVSASALFPLHAFAAESCESSFKSNHDKQRDAMFFGASRAIPYLDVEDTLQQLDRIARAAGFDVRAKDTSASGRGDLTLVQKQTDKAREILFVVRADANAGKVGIATAFPSGMKANPADVRKIFCGMLAQVKAPPAPAAASGGRGSPQQAAPLPDRTAPPSVEEKLVKVSPKAQFDRAFAQAALAEGSSTITGQACVKHQGAISLVRNSPVFLYPVTPYLEEALQVMRSAKAGRDRVVLDPDMMRYRLEGKTNNDGEFRFSRLKPGRYYLTAEHGSSYAVQQDVQVGSYTSRWGGGSIIQRQNVGYDYTDLLERYVDIKQDGEVVSTYLVPKPNMALWAAISGCKDW